MTTRRHFLTVLAALLSGGAVAQQKTARIGLLWLGAPDNANLRAALLDRLREHGYVEGRNLVIEDRTGARRYEDLLEAAQDLARIKVDVIITFGATSVRAARRATTTIPVIMAAGLDPVKDGLAASLGRPGGNVTGVSTLSDELHGKWVQLLRDTLPHAGRVGALVNPTSDAGTGYLRSLQKEGRGLGLELEPFEVRAATDLDAAVSSAANMKVEALLVVPATMFSTLRSRIGQLALQHRLPCFAYSPEFAEAGALLAYGISRERTFRRVADFANRILRGRLPAEMPIERSTEFELVLNRTTAKTLGVRFPPSVLVRATRTID